MPADVPVKGSSFYFEGTFRHLASGESGTFSIGSSNSFVVSADIAAAELSPSQTNATLTISKHADHWFDRVHFGAETSPATEAIVLDNLRRSIQLERR